MRVRGCPRAHASCAELRKRAASVPRLGMAGQPVGALQPARPQHSGVLSAKLREQANKRPAADPGGEMSGR